jgi:hypothetical protein
LAGWQIVARFIVAQFIGEARTGYEWLIDGIAAAIGAVVASAAAASRSARRSGAIFCTVMSVSL